MPAFTATAPGKIILFGEHAVVYGRPAIAVPVPAVRARAVISANPLGAPGSVKIDAPDIELTAFLSDLPPTHPLSAAIHGTLHQLGLPRSPACSIKITSTIPVAAGMGSGAAVTAALVRAFSVFLGKSLPDEYVSALTYEVEKIHHGTPSGVDNTVVTYARPVYFQRREPQPPLIEPFTIPLPFELVIADTGIPSSTAVAVGDVRAAWLADPERFNSLFDSVADIVRAARREISAANPQALGPLMDENHRLLQKIGVSSPELDRLVKAACQAGALGAKMVGGGRGGSMIALAPPAASAEIASALEAAGAARTIPTVIA